jgi:uncharacterized protein (TIGR00369 family)
MSEPAGSPLQPGVVPREAAQAMSGLDLLRGWLEGRICGPSIGTALDFRLVEVERGRVMFSGTPDARFLNPLGTVHGGYAATLLDSCMGCAVHSMLAPGQGYTTLEIKVNYVRAMSPQTGAVFAEGRVLHAGRQAATAEGFLRDAGGKLIAHGTTTCIVFTP